MKVKYNSDMKEWIAETPDYTYRISIIKCFYVLELIKPSDSQLVYCDSYTTLGAALEAVMRDEMHNAVNQ